MPHLVVNVTVVAVGLRGNAITGRAVGAAKVKLESKGGWLFDLNRRGRVCSIGVGLEGELIENDVGNSRDVPHVG